MSQHLGGPEAAEHGDELLAPGGTVDVTAIGAGGEEGADETLFYKERKKNEKLLSKVLETL